MLYMYAYMYICTHNSMSYINNYKNPQTTVCRPVCQSLSFAQCASFFSLLHAFSMPKNNLEFFKLVILIFFSAYSDSFVLFFS